MATKTAGTKLTTSLTALQWQSAGLAAADVATIQQAIKQYNTNTTPIVPGALEGNLLFLPDNKSPGGIRIDPGDWIMVDGKGFPVIIPNSIFSTSWQHS